VVPILDGTPCGAVDQSILKLGFFTDDYFAEMAALLGFPPKVIWLRAGNQSTASSSTTIRRHANVIVEFWNDDTTACLEIY
jgi:predicted nuclease of predicted toxin-antitoxin system